MEARSTSNGTVEPSSSSMNKVGIETCPTTEEAVEDESERRGKEPGRTPADMYGTHGTGASSTLTNTMRVPKTSDTV